MKKELIIVAFAYSAFISGCAENADSVTFQPEETTEQEIITESENSTETEPDTLLFEEFDPFDGMNGFTEVN